MFDLSFEIDGLVVAKIEEIFVTKYHKLLHIIVVVFIFLLLFKIIVKKNLKNRNYFWKEIVVNFFLKYILI